MFRLSTYTFLLSLGYANLFKPIMQTVVNHYQPSCIVLQVSFIIRARLKATVYSSLSYYMYMYSVSSLLCNNSIQNSFLLRSEWWLLVLYLLWSFSKDLVTPWLFCLKHQFFLQIILWTFLLRKGGRLHGSLRSDLILAIKSQIAIITFKYMYLEFH